MSGNTSVLTMIIARLAITRQTKSQITSPRSNFVKNTANTTFSNICFSPTFALEHTLGGNDTNLILSGI